MHILPHGRLSASLGTYKVAEQPKGFCIELGSTAKPEESELISADVTTRALPNGQQYVLIVVNNSSKRLRANVRTL